MKSNTKTLGKRKSRRPRTQMQMTMKHMVLSVIASGSVLVNHRFDFEFSEFEMKLTLKFIEFYRIN